MIHGRTHLFAWSAVASCILAILTSTALAGEKELFVTLRYEVDASTRGCWDEARFRRGVANRIGYDPFREQAPLEVQIHVGGSASAVDGQVLWREANGAGMGERTFVAKDGNCGKLMTEMSFAVGLQIEFLRIKPPKPTATSPDVSTPAPTAPSPSPTMPESPSPPAPPVRPETSPPVESPPPPPPKPALETAAPPKKAEQAPQETPPEQTEPSPSEPAPHWSLWVGAGPGLAWRLAPGLTADGRLFVGAGRDHLSFEIGAEATYPSRFERWDGSGFRHTLIGASAALCGHIDWFSTCALGRASQVRITGQGVDEPRSPNGFVAQVGARLAVTLHLAGPWSLATHIDGLTLLSPSRVHLNQALVWEMPRLGAVAGIDVMARFR